MVKKLLGVAFTLCLALGAKAQNNFTVWYGINSSNVSLDGGSAGSEFKALNFGLSYTDAINDKFDWSAGVGYVTKGAEEWSPGFIQLEGSGAWNFFSNTDAKIGIFTGPSISFMVLKDDAENTKTFGVGWQAGLAAAYKFLSFKLGYEYGFTDVLDGGKSKPSQIYFRIGYNF